MGLRRFILHSPHQPGDVLALTGAIYSLRRQYVDQYQVAVDCAYPELLEHNPDVVPLARARLEGWEEVPAGYDLVNHANQLAVHMMEGYCRSLGHYLGKEVPLLTNRPAVYLSSQERCQRPPVEEILGRRTRYWVVNAGRKSDYTAKYWGRAHFQEVVDRLQGQVLFVQVGHRDHYHPPLQNVVNRVGKTDLRQLVRLVYHAEGCLTGVSLLHHLAAGLEKPCVTLLGGREPIAWNSYPRCQLLHVIGSLPCCQNGGCWRSRTVPLGDGDPQDTSLCEYPLTLKEEPVPKCLMMISPQEVVQKIQLSS